MHTTQPIVQIFTTSNYRRSNKHDVQRNESIIEQCRSSHPEKRPEFWQVAKVSEEFETLVTREGNLDLLQDPTCLDHRKGLRHWI
ncbi:hypothetical protein Hanom_Chr13g01197691 [Helianthus anomalus]